ncbi:MAG: nodulation protein NfeD [Gammaproteobacteria bacterium]|nr:nodulation protein NfeD [Gammaproteobacteria bacterium]
MGRTWLLGWFLLACPALAWSAQARLLDVRDAIGPAIADYVVRGIDAAEAAGEPLVIIRLDTPGGLDASMRAIVQRILAAEIPVVTWVAPSGARAASAGTFILYASHVAAMAPATNLGAATPVSIGAGGPGKGAPSGGGAPGGEKAAEEGGEAVKKPPGTAMERKAMNDAAAYIHGLAELRGRNVEWAERAVTEAASLSAEEAVRENVVDLVVADLDGLLEALDGRVVEVKSREVTLATADLAVTEEGPDWRSELLSIITNPNVAYMLMLLGVYGIFFELANPGAIVPGVIGAIALVLALYAFAVLPVNYAGVVLVLIGMAFMVGEVFMPSFGALGIGGIAAFVAGSVILMDSDMAAFSLSFPLIVALSLTSLAFMTFVTGMLLRQRRKPVVSGREEMVGSVGEALEDFTGDGGIHIHGETWQARSAVPVARGQAVRVTALDGLVLEVEPIDKES